jgi:hypothetical protein
MWLESASNRFINSITLEVLNLIFLDIATARF